MFRGIQIAFKRRRRERGRCAGFVMASLLFTPAMAGAQTSPKILGWVSGDDISVEGGTSGVPGGNARGVAVSSGSGLTVHSGQARIELTAGGEIDVCGPARLTLLESGGAVTVALNLGRVRVQLPNATPLILYTPFFVATPIAITDGPRDVTLGLQDNGALCVFAAQGGVRLEQQLTGQSVMVPQPNELTLMGGDLIPIGGVSGGCRCGFLSGRAAPAPVPLIPPTPIPYVSAAAAPSESKRPAVSAEKRSALMPENPKPTPPITELSIPASENEAHPVAPAANPPQPNSPPAEQPIWKVMMPPLSFDASSPLPPPDPSPDTILLVREVRVDPNWVFRGRVGTGFEPALPAARARPAKPQRTARDAPHKKKGFFAKVGNFFRTLAGAPPCAGAGCSQ